MFSACCIWSENEAAIPRELIVDRPLVNEWQQRGINISVQYLNLTWSRKQKLWAFKKFWVSTAFYCIELNFHGQNLLEEDQFEYLCLIFWTISRGAARLQHSWGDQRSQLVQVADGGWRHVPQQLPRRQDAAGAGQAAHLRRLHVLLPVAGSDDVSVKKPPTASPSSSWWSQNRTHSEIARVFPTKDNLKIRNNFFFKCRCYKCPSFLVKIVPIFCPMFIPRTSN